MKLKRCVEITGVLANDVVMVSSSLDLRKKEKN
jgi:hypothetical protein